MVKIAILNVNKPIASASERIVQSTNNTRISNEAVPLPDGFRPGINDIICGKGSECFNHVGNKRYRKILEDNMELYFSTASKKGKTWLISEIVSDIRQKSYPGGFVRRDLLSGKFFEVGEFGAREKTSHALREMLTRKGSCHKVDGKFRLLPSDKSTVKFSVASSPTHVLSSFPVLTGERNEENASFKTGLMEAQQFLKQIASPSKPVPNTCWSSEDHLFDCFEIGLTSEHVTNESKQFHCYSENNWKILSPCPHLSAETLETTNEILFIYNQWKNESNGFSTR